MLTDAEFIQLLLMDCSFSITLNANDVFDYACSDAVTIDSMDYDWAFPIIRKYTHEGLIAVMSYIRQQDPIQPRITIKFKQIYQEIVDLNPTVYSRDLD